MGTTLTGTSVKDTYDSLIKVTDNGPISGTAKFLSDGLGNDSALALSTAAVGIGTAVPSQPLVVFKADAGNDIGQIIQQGSNGTAAFLNIVGANDAGASFNRITSSTSGGTAHWQLGGGGTASTMVLLTGGTEKMRITSAGNVGIGTSSPALKLNISNGGAQGFEFDPINGVGGRSLMQVFNRATSAYAGLQFDAVDYMFSSAGTERVRFQAAGGISFNGDTAAANALDDYEEGTWTPTSNSAGYTISSASGSYTKIGRQVVIRGNVEFSAVNASSTSLFIYLGLPFTPSLSFQGVCREDSTTGAIFMAQVRVVPDGILNSMDGVTTASQQAFAISKTYRFTVTYFV